MCEWTGWKEIRVLGDLIGETITKGTGIYEKEYRYICAPPGSTYEGYVFFLAESLVNLRGERGNLRWSFTICHDMKIELFYSPELREEGKRYKRYKMSGHELYETVFREHEEWLLKEEEIKLHEEKDKQEKKHKSKIGKIICGRYMGNMYAYRDCKYTQQAYLSVFFTTNNSTYSNGRFEKVQNVKYEFVIAENVSKHYFLQNEANIKAYISDYEMYKSMYVTLEKRLLQNEHALVTTKNEDIAQAHMNYCKAAMEEIKRRLCESLGG